MSEVKDTTSVPPCTTPASLVPTGASNLSKANVSMASAVPKKLTIRWQPSKLSEDVKLVLTFQRGTAQDEPFPWKVITLNADAGMGMNEATFIYYSTYGFACHSLTPDGVEVSSVIACDIGHSVSLEKKGDRVVWKDPSVTKTAKLCTAQNNTTASQTISFGPLKPDYSNYSPAFKWTLTAGNTIDVEFKPVLLAYTYQSTKETEFISGNITSLLILEQDLTLLPTSSAWDFIEGAMGDFSLKPVSAC